MAARTAARIFFKHLQLELIVNKDTDTLSTIIDKAFDDRASLDLQNPPPAIRTAVQTAIDMLDRGTARVAEKTAGGWVVHQWLKKAVLLHFGIERNVRIEAGFTDFYDKVPIKYANCSQEEFAAGGVRVVEGEDLFAVGLHGDALTLRANVQHRRTRAYRREVRGCDDAVAGLLGLGR